MRNFSAGIRARIRLLYFWLSRRDIRERVGVRELIRNFLTPRCENVAARFAEFKNEDDEYAYYAVKGFSNLFSYPKILPYHNFAQVISEGLLKYHWHHYEIPQTDVRAGDVIVDCGSAEGFFAFKYAGHCRHIYCIEPLPVFNRALHKLYDGLDNITIISAALSDKTGSLYLSPSSISSTCRPARANEQDICVQAVMLDSLFAEKSIRIDYLKADLEGFEELMIKGALNTIKMSRPKIVLTTYHQGQDFRTLINLIQKAVPDYQYLLKGIEETQGNPVMLHMWCP
jgi:FkbM family methyltransferase